MRKRKILWIGIPVVVIVVIIIAAAASSGHRQSPGETTAASNSTTQFAASSTSPSTLAPAAAATTTATSATPASTEEPVSSSTISTEPVTTTSTAPAVEHNTYEGKGDDLVALEGIRGPALLRIKAAGGEYTHFAVTSLDADNEPIDLLVNTLGPYEGTVAVGLDDRIPVALEVKASATWTIEQAPISEAPRLVIPGSIEGEGDSVVALMPGATKLTISGGKANTNFAVIQYGGLFPDLLVNEIGTYKGTVRANKEGGYLVIHASAPWHITAE